MNKKGIMVGAIGLLAGIRVAGLAAGQTVNNNKAGMMRMTHGSY